MLKGWWNKLATSAIMLAMVPWPFPNDWVGFQKDNSHTGYTDQTFTGQLVSKWSKQSTLSRFLMPLYQDGVFYLTEVNETTGNFSIYAVKEADNMELWRYSGVSIEPPTVRLSRSYIMISCDNLITLNLETGIEVWKVSAGINATFSKLAIDADNIYVWRKIKPATFSLCDYKISNGSKSWETPVLNASAVFDPTFTYSASYITFIDNVGSTTVEYFDTYSGGLFDPISFQGRAAWPLVSGNYGYITTISGDIIPFDLYENQILETLPVPNATITVIKDSTAYFLSNDLITNSIRFNSLTIDYDWDANDNLYYIYDHQIHPVSPDVAINSKTIPIIANDRLYFGMKNGEVWSVALDGTGLKKYKIAPNNNEITSLIIANKTFIAESADSKTLYAFGFDPSVQPAISLKSPYDKNDDFYHEYLGQTHSHYIPDILPKKGATPAKTVQKYKDAEYDFIALTEHNIMAANPNIEGITFFEDSEEDTQGWFGNHILAMGITNPVDEKLDDQTRVNKITRDQSGFASLAHPNSFFYQWKINELKSLGNYHAIEIYNAGIDKESKYVEPPTIDRFDFRDKAEAVDKWDELLSGRQFIFGTAGDDYTPGNLGFDNAAVVVLAKSDTQDEIMANLKSGNFYALQGSKAPRIKVETEGTAIKVISNQQGTITFIGKDGKVLKSDGNVTQSSYDISGSEIYVRAEVAGDNGLKAWSQPIELVNNLKKTAEGSGRKIIETDQAELAADTTDTLTVSTVSSAEAPPKSPIWGYLSPIYDFATSGNLVGQARLTIDYSAQKLLTAEDNLSVFTYNAANSLWERVASTVDKVNKKVTANLSHFSLYTLSSDQTGDTAAPVLELANADELDSAAGQIDLLINAADDSQVYNLSGYLDKETLLFSDSDYTDGFDQSIDFAQYPFGKHRLTLLATDTFGNRTTREFTFKTADPAKTPQIKIVEKQRGRNACKKFVLRGKYLNAKDAAQVNIFLGNEKLGEVPVKNGTFEYVFDPSAITENQFVITIKARDKKGQTVIKKVRVEKNCPNGKKIRRIKR